MRSSRYQTADLQSLKDLERLLAGTATPVLLLEGIRALPETDRAMVVAMGALVARRLPNVRFRSGNAAGTDTAFAEGVASVAPDRMECVITHAGMGRGRRRPGVRAFSLGDMPHAAEGDLADYTVAASPDIRRLIEAYRTHGRAGPLGARAAYLLRDTIKVVGAPELSLETATAGLFYVNPGDPLAGGTGHTLRVCLQHGLPVVFQSVWGSWLAVR